MSKGDAWKCGHFRYSGLRSLSIVATLVFAAFFGAQANAQPVIESITPFAVASNQATDLTLAGKELAGITSIWTSAGSAEVAKEPPKNGESPAHAVLKLNLADVRPGIVGLRIATAKGLSELALVMVDELPSVVDGGQNKSAATAQAITLPTTISARIAGKGERRFYRFATTGKQRVSVDVFAHRLGERFDPVATLFDATGPEIASCDDDRATRQDPRFEVELPSAGEYTLEIRDIRYREGRFVVRIGDLPLTSVAIDIPSEKAGNDTPEGATPVSVPTVLGGTIESAGDRDLFRFVAKKGERVIATNFSRGLFSPGDFVIRFLKEDGAKISEVDDRETGGESRLEFDPPADGNYLLSIEEADRRGAADCAYRVDLRRSSEAIRLRAKVDRFAARPGGTFAVLLERDRPGFDGPVEISLAEPIPGVELSHRIHTKKTGEERLFVSVPADAKAGELRAFRLVAKAVGSNGPGEPIATELTGIGSPRRFLLAPQLNGQMAFVIVGEALPLFALKTTATDVPLDRASGQAKFVVAIDHTHKDYKETPVVLAEGLPPGATIEGKKKSDSEIDVTITAPKDLPAGKHSLKLIGFGEFQGRGHKSAIEGVTLVVP